MDREQTAHEAIECQQGNEVRKDVPRPKVVEISAIAIIRTSLLGPATYTERYNIGSRPIYPRRCHVITREESQQRNGSPDGVPDMSHAKKMQRHGR